MGNIKINKSPTNYAQKFEQNKSTYDFYLENGIFSLDSMVELLYSVSDKRKYVFFDMLGNCVKHGVNDRYKIQFRFNTGTYRLVLRLNARLFTNWNKFKTIAEELGMLKGTSYDKQNFTEFYIDYDDYTVFTLRDLFYKPFTNEDKKLYNSKKFIKFSSIFPWEKTIMKDLKTYLRNIKNIEKRIIKEEQK